MKTSIRESEKKRETGKETGKVRKKKEESEERRRTERGSRARMYRERERKEGRKGDSNIYLLRLSSFPQVLFHAMRRQEGFMRRQEEGSQERVNCM